MLDYEAKAVWFLGIVTILILTYEVRFVSAL